MPIVEFGLYPSCGKESLANARVPETKLFERNGDEH